MNIELTKQELNTLMDIIEAYSHQYDFDSAVDSHGFVTAVRETADRYNIIKKLNDAKTKED